MGDLNTFVNLAEKPAHRGRVFANVGRNFPGLLIRGDLEERHMLFRVGRAFVIVSCVSAAALESAVARGVATGPVYALLAGACARWPRSLSSITSEHTSRSTPGTA